MKEVFDASNEIYRSPRIAEALKRDGHRISKRRVAKFMPINGWSLSTRLYTNQTVIQACKMLYQKDK